jgi:hypothetical protein
MGEFEKARLPATDEAIAIYVLFSMQCSDSAYPNPDVFQFRLIAAVGKRKPSLLALDRTCNKLLDTPRPKYRPRWSQAEFLET